MNEKRNPTRDRIVLSALALFSERGIRKTSVEEIAFHAGLTRVTIYRYFPEKKDLVLEVYLHVEQIFQNGLAELEQNPQAGGESVLKHIAEGLSALPASDVFARADELKRLYPDVYDSIQQVRVVTLNGLFEHLFAMVESQGLLRPGLNRAIVQAIFWELIVNFFDHQKFKVLGLTDAELFHTMTDIFQFGILKHPPLGI